MPGSREVSAVAEFAEFVAVASLTETEESNNTGGLHMTVAVIVPNVSSKVGHVLDIPIEVTDP